MERQTILVDHHPGDQYTHSAFVADEYGVRSTIAAPLLRGDRALGALAFARTSEEAFTPSQVALIETYADQAVIAIENARLFNELQARNQEITESLRREEASSEILRQISRAPEELDTTLQAIAVAARRLTGQDVGLSLLEGEFRVVRGRSFADDSGMSVVLGTRVPRSERFRRPARSGQPLLWNRSDASGVDGDVEFWLVARNHRRPLGQPRQALMGNLEGKTPLSPPTLVTLNELLGYPTLGGLQGGLWGRGWGEPIFPLMVSLGKGKGSVIIEPWDPLYAREDIRDRGAEAAGQRTAGGRAVFAVME